MKNMLLIRLIIKCDELFKAQLNVICKDKRLLQLQASWHGLLYLAQCAATQNAKLIKIKVLNISWKTLANDLNRVVDIEQSILFNKIYTQEFDLPGGEPYGLLIGDYQISHKLNAAHSLSDITALHMMKSIAAASFSPYVTAADPSLFGLDDFSGLIKNVNFDRIFQQDEYQQWRKLRTSEDSIFIGILLPKILLNPARLWINPSYGFAAITMQAFSQAGWFADMCGGQQNTINGIIPNIVAESFTTDSKNLISKISTEICITDSQEKKLSDQGFIAICSNHFSAQNIIYHCNSTHLIAHNKDLSDNQNLWLSGQLNYILCVARFAHYIKIITREKIGSFATTKACEDYLRDWLRQYTAANNEMTPALQAKYPLRAAKINVYEKIGQPGAFYCTLSLAPHYRFDNAEITLQFSTELAQKR